MRTITASDLARNTSMILDQVAGHGETVLVERNQRPVAQLIPACSQQTAMEAFKGLQGVLSEDAAEGWLDDSRQGLDESVRDPWE